MVALAEKRITIPSTGGLPIWLTCWLPKGADQCPVVLVIPGLKGFTRWGSFPHICQAIASGGKAVIGIDFSCGGVENFGSEITRIDLAEKDSPSRQIAEVNLVMDELRGAREGWLAQLDRDNFWVLGHSRGGAIAILAAEGKSCVRGVVTWSSISTFSRYPAEVIEMWKAAGHLNVPNARTGQDYFLGRDFLNDVLSFPRDKVLNCLSRLGKPVLIVHGEADTSVPAEEAHELFDAAAPELRELCIIPKGDDNYGAIHPFAGITPELERAIEVTKNWLERQRKN
jgi:uncharacterized protein